jgi:peroxiredoxin Q/BCP
LHPLASHAKAREKLRLLYLLLADENRHIMEAYGVWAEKMFMGRRHLGIHRMIFLIGSDRRIEKIWSQVKPVQHAAEAPAAL